MPLGFIALAPECLAYPRERVDDLQLADHMSQIDFRIPRSAVEGADDETLCWAVVEPIWPDQLYEDELARIAKGTTGQQAIYCTMLFAREVDNGGLKQFLGNSSGMYWRNVVTGLKLLGANEHLTALSIALTIFPGGEPSLEQSEREEVLNRMIASQQAALRSAQDSVYSAGGFEQLLLPRWKRYIDAHPDEFFL
jgi:Domain of unknown function (DUF4375)